MLDMTIFLDWASFTRCATDVDAFGGHDGSVAAWREHGDVSGGSSAGCEPSVGAIQGTCRTCRGGVCGPKGVVGERGRGDGGLCGLYRGRSRRSRRRRRRGNGDG